MIESTGPLLRVLRVAAIACLPLLGGCATQSGSSTKSPPGVDVPEPGNGRAGVSTQPAAQQHSKSQAQPQSGPRTAKAYPAGVTPAPAVIPAARPSYPAQPGQAASPSGYPVAPGVTARPAPPAATPLPGAAAAPSEDSFTIESGDGGTATPGNEAAPDSAPANGGATPQRIEPSAPPRSANAAVNILLAQAETENRAGNLDGAIAAAERALRIAPADPAAYCALATLRLQHADFALAEQLARKGLSYQPDAELQQRLNAIIEHARQGRTG